jgi:hypothetical protein
MAAFAPLNGLCPEAGIRNRSLVKVSMKIALNAIGMVLVVFGGIWLLQGINVLPGSFMSGQIRWAIYGGIAVAAGVALLVAARRRSS